MALFFVRFNDILKLNRYTAQIAESFNPPAPRPRAADRRRPPNL
jgi:hypothetical protein